MREVSGANDGIRARCWQNPCGCGAADVTVEDNSENGMSGGRGWDVPAGTFIDIKSGHRLLYILPLQVHECLSIVWIPRSLDFGIINPVFCDLDPQAVSGRQHLIPILRCQLSACLHSPSGTVRLRRKG